MKALKCSYGGNESEYPGLLPGSLRNYSIILSYLVYAKLKVTALGEEGGVGAEFVLMCLCLRHRHRSTYKRARVELPTHAAAVL